MRTGSLQNMLADQSQDAAAVAFGVGATVVSWTDRHAATIIEVSASGHKITVQYDTAVRTDSNGMSDAQSYEFARDERGRTQVFTRRKNGDYRIVGGSTRLLVGVRSQYHDYSF
jgi:hypothetical protein